MTTQELITQEVCYVCLRIDGRQFYRELREMGFPAPAASEVVSWIKRIYERKPTFLCGKSGRVVKAVLGYIGAKTFLPQVLHMFRQVDFISYYNLSSRIITLNKRAFLEALKKAGVFPRESLEP